MAFYFAAIIPEEQDISNFQSGISILLGAVTGILVLMIIKYNGAHRTQQTARKAFSDIKVYEEKQIACWIRPIGCRINT